MKVLITSVAIVVLVALGITGFAYSGLYDVSAMSPHSGLTNWLLSTISHASVERSAKGIEVPNLDDDALVLAGINDFDSMCAGCHGAPGRGPEPMGQGLNPPPPDLAEEAAELTPAELFWVTRNGIKMTGMPAWGTTHDDNSIWPVVAFMKKLPDLDESAYQDMLQAAAGLGHHTGDAAAEEHSHVEDGEPSGATIQVHGDGSKHLHEEPAKSAALVAIIDAIEKGWEQGDGTPFREHYLDFDGARYVESGGQNEGLSDLIEHHVVPEGEALDNFELSLSNIETHVEGDIAWVIADVEYKALVKEGERQLHGRGYETFLFRRVDGQWKVIHTHSSSRPVTDDHDEDHH